MRKLLRTVAHSDQYIVSKNRTEKKRLHLLASRSQVFYQAAQYIISIYASCLSQTVQALRKPLMAAVLSHLHHSALSQPWGIRVAAVQAIAKVAVRSEEPYKLQGYTILKSLSAPDYISDPDATGGLCLSVYLPVCV